MGATYELVLPDRERKIVAAVEPIRVGDAVAIDNEIWLVLRESDRASTTGRARFDCRRALKLRLRAEELVAYAKQLGLQVTTAREAPSTLQA
jgi:hypothetical protein